MQVRPQLSRYHRRLILSLSTLVVGIGLLFTADRMLWSADNAADTKPATDTKPAAGSPAPSLEIHQGDHICLIGNTLADRMQHDGWLETYLYSRFPKDDLVVRDLGFSGDELTFRLRSARLRHPRRASVVQQGRRRVRLLRLQRIVCRRRGPRQVQARSRRASSSTRSSEKYNGKSAPRLVLFSPIAHEDLHDRNLPDGSENNGRLELYTTAMAEVAKANHVPFVDLFEPTLKAYAQAAKPLTINGIHLNPHGDEVVAQIIDQALFGRPIARRSAIRRRWKSSARRSSTKTSIWFNRYRTVDGYSIYGGRADLRVRRRQTNRDVAQREMEVLDVMTANRDKRIWAVAQGGDLKVDDSNTPPFIPSSRRTSRASGPNGDAHLPRPARKRSRR